MIIPIRCFTCNKPISAKYLIYLEKKKRSQDDIKEEDDTLCTEKVNNGQVDKSKIGKILDDLEISRYCCRRMFLGQVDIIDII